MHRSLLLLSLIPATLATPLVKRDATSIVNSINKIESNIATLNNSLNNLGPGLLELPEVLQIQLEDTTLQSSIDDATRTASASAPLSTDDSNTVAAAVLTLPPQISSLLSNIVSKKPVFDKAILGFGSVSPLVEQDLIQQNNSAAAFGAALVPKLAQPYAGLAPVVLGEIVTAFNAAIQAYAGSSIINL